MSEQPRRYVPIAAAVLLLIALFVVPLILLPGAEFGGADGQAGEAIRQINPGYHFGWITNLWSPPGTETESMLFALQAAIGGALIGYFFGFKRGQRRPPVEGSQAQ